ncbi:MAG: FAD-dependent oxidoreductase [Planctomycetota bacterium]
MRDIQEHLTPTPICHECDCVVIGGSCTGVFAAVRAARLGLSVAIVEAHNCFGGVATTAGVNIWHSLYDTRYDKRIIGGLTVEVIDLLRHRHAIEEQPQRCNAFHLNTEELKIVLDGLVRTHRIRPFLHTRFAAPICTDDGLTAVAIEDQQGRRAIRARCFIDASGDGVLVARAGYPTRTGQALQPPTTCAKIQGLQALRARHPGLDISRVLFDAERHPEALADGFVWTAPVPGATDTTLLAGTRLHGVDVSHPDQLSQAEIDGRDQVDRIMRMLRREAGDLPIALIDLAAHIGSRESRHACCLHRLREDELLHGVTFADAIAAGSYRVDIHFPDRAGLVFRYLDGTEVELGPEGPRIGRWRPPLETGSDPNSYQIPLRSLIPIGSDNVLVAGRIIDADPGAFGAVRVMVTANQMGEAAGVAAAVHLRSQVPMHRIDAHQVRRLLAAGGSLVPPQPGKTVADRTMTRSD